MDIIFRDGVVYTREVCVCGHHVFSSPDHSIRSTQPAEQNTLVGALLLAAIRFFQDIYPHHVYMYDRLVHRSVR